MLILYFTTDHLIRISKEHNFCIFYAFSDRNRN